MGDIYAFPYDGATRLAGRLDRLVERWQRGGVEEYSISGAGRRPGRAEALRRRWQADQAIEVTAHRISLPILPEAFRGFRIVHLTDIHHGLYLPIEAVEHGVQLANGLDPDLVVLTGDFVTFSPAYIEPVARVLGGLRARHGVFAVLGNHDFRVSASRIARALGREGVTVLRNQHTALRRPGGLLHLAGVDDLRYRADLGRALRGIPPGAATVLLSHNPGIIRRAAAAGVGLVLSGHTHGGQVNLPLLGSIYGRSLRRRRFKVGWDRLGGTQIYVSRGIGTVVVPVRYRCPAEIPHLRLEPEDSRCASAAPRR
jgi:uncharacterized protein